MIYTINGENKEECYNINGDRLPQCYDINGNPLLDTKQETLKVLSYNVGSWTAFGRAATVQNQQTWYQLQNNILSNVNSDIAGFQEYYNKIGNYSVTKMLGFYYGQTFAVDKATGKAGRAISSKFTMQDSEEINFTHQRGEERSYLHTKLTINDKTVHFLNAHLSYEIDIAELQIDELLDVVQNYEYWILTGDFNVVFNSETDNGYIILVKKFLDSGYNVANGSTFGFIPTFNGGTPESQNDWRCIDNVMCSSNIEILDAYTNTLKLSHAGYGIDHLPLIADIKIH